MYSLSSFSDLWLTNNSKIIVVPDDISGPKSIDRVRNSTFNMVSETQKMQKFHTKEHKYFKIGKKGLFLKSGKKRITHPKPEIG